MKRLKGFLTLLLAMVLCLTIAGLNSPASADDHTAMESPVADGGLVRVRSDFSVSETGDRLEALIADRSLTLFTRIDHAANAASVGKELRPTEVVVFGNPNVGTPLMQCSQSVAIDLPQKMLIWQDADGQVWLAYNDPNYLAARHQIEGCERVLGRISQVLGDLTQNVAVR
ncbi:MAG: DUF302 domain-containing protein [Leptolyngbyaceae cyanobacterium]